MTPDSAATRSQADDRVLSITRLVSALIIPFLVLAFIILYFYPDESGQRFAWAIRPHMQAMYIAAGYIGGCYLFLRAALGARWHEVAAGFLPVMVFVISMLLLTLFHWDRFDLQRFPAQVWLILYVITPVLIPWLWWRNRPADSDELAPDDIVVPLFVRRLMGGFGVLLLIVALLGFIFPDWLIGFWSWLLTPFSAQAMAGWLALLGAGGIVISRERRWSGWRIGLTSIAIWHILVLIAAALNPGDFTGGSLLNGYNIIVVIVLAAMLALYVWMERRRRVESPQPVSSPAV